MTVRAALIAILLYTFKVAMDPNNYETNFPGLDISNQAYACRMTCLSLNLQDLPSVDDMYAFEIKHNGVLVCEMTVQEVVAVLKAEFPPKVKEAA